MRTKLKHNTKCVAVTWVEAQTLFKLKGKEKKLILGLCSHTKRVFSLATNWLKPMVITNIYITDNVCEEGSRCLDGNCEFNTTTWESLSKALGLGNKKPKNFDIKKGKWHFDKNDNFHDFSDVTKNWNTHSLVMLDKEKRQIHE